MGDLQVFFTDLSVSIKKEIEVESPRPLGRNCGPFSAVTGLDGEEQIEELRGEGDDEPLTAETLAERIGESTPREEDF